MLVSANEMHQEGLSEVEIIVIALAVALVVVAIIIAVCKIVEVKKAKSGYVSVLCCCNTLPSTFFIHLTVDYLNILLSRVEMGKTINGKLIAGVITGLNSGQTEGLKKILLQIFQ